MLFFSLRKSLTLFLDCIAVFGDDLFSTWPKFTFKIVQETFRKVRIIDFRCMADRNMHGSGVRLVNSTDGVQLELERTASGSGTINCQVFVIADAQFNILGNQMNDVQY